MSQDPLPLGNFQNEILEEIRKVEPDHVNHLRKGIDLLLTLYRRSPHKVSQAYGLYRIWGHPVINTVAGVISLQEIAKQYRHGDTQTNQLITGKFEKFL